MKSRRFLSSFVIRLSWALSARGKAKNDLEVQSFHFEATILPSSAGPKGPMALFSNALEGKDLGFAKRPLHLGPFGTAVRSRNHQSLYLTSLY